MSNKHHPRFAAYSAALTVLVLGSMAPATSFAGEALERIRIERPCPLRLSSAGQTVHVGERVGYGRGIRRGALRADRGGSQVAAWTFAAGGRLGTGHHRHGRERRGWRPGRRAVHTVQRHPRAAQDAVVLHPDVRRRHSRRGTQRHHATGSRGAGEQSQDAAGVAWHPRAGHGRSHPLRHGRGHQLGTLARAEESELQTQHRDRVRAGLRQRHQVPAGRQDRRVLRRSRRGAGRDGRQCDADSSGY